MRLEFPEQGITPQISAWEIFIEPTVLTSQTTDEVGGGETSAALLFEFFEAAQDGPGMNGVRKPKKTTPERWEARPHDHRQVHVTRTADDALFQNAGGFIHHGQHQTSTDLPLVECRAAGWDRP